MAPWKLPLIVAAIAIPVVAAFLLGGPGVGVAVGALVAVVILAIAVRQRPRGPIGSGASENGIRHVLLVVTSPIDEPAAVRELVREAGLEGIQGETAVRVLAPASIRFLDRWASDVEKARDEAQESLVATVAALAKAGIVAEARVGDEDIVQAVEDQLQSFPAGEVVLVSVGAKGGQHADAAAAELRSRLRAEFRHVALGDG